MTNQTQRDDGYRDVLLSMAGQRGLLQRALGKALDPYSRGGVWAKVVDLPGDKAVSCGIEVEGGGQEIADELDRLQVVDRFRQALALARRCGGAAILILADDAPDLSVPLNVNALKRIRALRVLDKDQLSPVAGTTDRDPSSPNYGQAELYTGDGSYTVHASRLLTFTGIEAEKTEANWRGAPEVLEAWQSLERLCEAMALSLEVLRRKQQGVYGMKGMAELFDAGLGDVQATGETERLVQRRLEMVDKSRGVLNTVAIDAEDDYTLQDMQLSGIKDVIGELQVDVSAHAGIPTTLLFQRSPAGQNATGESDFRGFYDSVSAIQAYKVKPPAERLVSLLYAQAELKAKAPEHWCIEFGPLFVPTPDEKAKTEKTEAEADKIRAETVDLLIGRDMIAADDGRAWLAHKGVIMGPAETGNASEYAQRTTT